MWQTITVTSAVTAAVWEGPESKQSAYRMAGSYSREHNSTKVTLSVNPGWDSNQVSSHWPLTDSFVLCEASINSGDDEECSSPTPLSLSPYDTGAAPQLLVK